MFLEPRPLARRTQWWAALAGLSTVAAPLVGLLNHTTVRTADGSTRPTLAYGLVALVNLVVLIIALVMRLRWLRLCRQNADLWAPGEATYSPGWVVGAWFTPLLMWWRPRRIVLDITRASSDGDGSVTRLVTIWWALHVSFSVAGLCVVVLKGTMTDTVDSSVQLALALCSLASLVLFLDLVGRITALQEARCTSDRRDLL